MFPSWRNKSKKKTSKKGPNKSKGKARTLDIETRFNDDNLIKVCVFQGNGAIFHTHIIEMPGTNNVVVGSICKFGSIIVSKYNGDDILKLINKGKVNKIYVDRPKNTKGFKDKSWQRKVDTSIYFTSTETVEIYTGSRYCEATCLKMTKSKNIDQKTPENDRIMIAYDAQKRCVFMNSIEQIGRGWGNPKLVKCRTDIRVDWGSIECIQFANYNNQDLVIIGGTDGYLYVYEYLGETKGKLLYKFMSYNNEHAWQNPSIRAFDYHVTSDNNDFVICCCKSNGEIWICYFDSNGNKNEYAIEQNKLSYSLQPKCIGFSPNKKCLAIGYGMGCCAIYIESVSDKSKKYGYTLIGTVRVPFCTRKEKFKTKRDIIYGQNSTLKPTKKLDNNTNNNNDSNSPKKQKNIMQTEHSHNIEFFQKIYQQTSDADGSSDDGSSDSSLYSEALRETIIGTKVNCLSWLDKCNIVFGLDDGNQLFLLNIFGMIGDKHIINAISNIIDPRTQVSKDIAKIICEYCGFAIKQKYIKFHSGTNSPKVTSITCLQNYKIAKGMFVVSFQNGIYQIFIPKN